MSARVPPFQCHIMITANNALFNVTDSLGGTIMTYVLYPSHSSRSLKNYNSVSVSNDGIILWHVWYGMVLGE
jgi:hypothetical protein